MKFYIIDNQLKTNLPIELLNHMLSYRPIHPNANIIKQKIKEFNEYRLPSGNPSVELDSSSGQYIVYSSPLIRNCESFIGNADDNGILLPVLFNEWFLIFMKNVEYFWANEYRYWD
jgi:hypothetical protein